METPETHVFPTEGSLRRQDFPNGFLFGASASAFQYEGAPDIDGRGPSIWDTFLIDRHPAGRRTNGAGINEKGIQFYNSLIDELLANGIKPMVTIFHWDVPQALEDEYHGFLDKKIVIDFVDYVDLCFSRFGDRVKHWITFNEPWSFSVGGYATGTLAPGRGDSSNARTDIAIQFPSSKATSQQASEFAGAPKQGNAATEPYIVSHHQLLAHAAAVQLYRQKYQRSQKGKIGITLVSNWAVPYHNTKEDRDAAQRAIDFMFGWFMDPITHGDYPSSMRSLVGHRLPKFSKPESELLKRSYDFLGFNYYTANYVLNEPGPPYTLDSRAKWTRKSNAFTSVTAPLSPKANQRG
ncbi:beta-glucosidase 24-like [Coffea arabica]|uniref:Beta-glucosidase 24-like n=1 Tax=Coffea arabica TaxID=13443 RepID=A0ABM4X8T5_COFAR